MLLGNQNQIEEQAARIRAALVSARSASATLPQLADAFELASKLNLHSAKHELGAHICAIVQPAQSNTRTIMVSVGFGVISGIITHFVLKSFGQKN